MNLYRPIGSRRMRPGTRVRQPPRESQKPVELHHPAAAVMTDLAAVPAVPVDPDVGIEAAMRIMMRRSVRSLFVVDVASEVIGLITATDLLGEKPLRHIHSHGGKRADIRVRDIMTPLAQLDVLEMSDVARARVGHVLATLRDAGRHHAMVVETGADGRDTVRGVFSASQLEKQLGMPIAISDAAHTFAEIEAALAVT